MVENSVFLTFGAIALVLEEPRLLALGDASVKLRLRNRVFYSSQTSHTNPSRPLAQHHSQLSPVAHHAYQGCLGSPMGFVIFLSHVWCPARGVTTTSCR